MSANSLPKPAAVWHSLEVDKTLQQLDSDHSGLSSQEVQQRLQKYGLNELKETAGRSPHPGGSVQNIMLLMLIAAVVSAVLDLWHRFPKDAIAISSIVILNGILGYLQESRAEKPSSSCRLH